MSAQKKFIVELEEIHTMQPRTRWGEVWANNLEDAIKAAGVKYGAHHLINDVQPEIIVKMFTPKNPPDSSN
jgi:hypothetical protein